MRKHCIFADSLLIVRYVQGVLLKLFFHNKLLSYNGIEYMKPLFFFFLFLIRRLHDMLLFPYSRSSQVKLLNTDEAQKALNVTENKINFITEIFFLKYYLDLGLLRLSSWEFFF